MNQKRVALLLDLILLVGATLVANTTVFTVLRVSDSFVDLSCLLISVTLTVITYFVGITAGLTFLLMFAFLQLTYVVHQHVYRDLLSYGSLSWLIILPLYCLIVYTVTYQTRTTEEKNVRLRRGASQLNVLDTVTNLKATKMCKERFDLLFDISTRYEAPLYLVMTRVACWEGIRNLSNPEQKNGLLQIVIAAIKKIADDCFSSHFIGGTPPAWALLIFHDEGDGCITREEFR